MLIFWVAIIIGIVFLVKWIMMQSGGRGSSRQDSESPLEILKRRYARGEIDQVEFEEKKKALLE